jgi:hypothetical protein
MQYHRDTTASQHNFTQMHRQRKEASSVEERYKNIHLQPRNSTSPHHPTITSIQSTIPHSLPNLFHQTHQSSTMAFFKTLLIASVAAVAFAAPQSGASDGNKKVEVSSSDNSQKCGNGSKIACCNSGEDLIGLNCLSVPIRKPLQPRCLALFPIPC